MISLKRYKIISSVFIAVVLCTFVFLAIYFWPFFKSLQDDAVRSDFIELVKGSWWGFLLFMGLQILQVVVCVIPGEVIEVLAGVIYGPFLGLLVCLVGVTIATIIIYVLVKLLGEPFVVSSVGERNFKRFTFLNDVRRSEFILFMLLFMPMTPKDAILYIAPLTKVKLHRFLIINAIARIPSIILSTLAGELMLDGKIGIVVLLYTINIIIAILCLIFNKQILKFFERFRKEQNN